MYMQLYVFLIFLKIPNFAVVSNFVVHRSSFSNVIYKLGIAMRELEIATGKSGNYKIQLHAL